MVNDERREWIEKELEKAVRKRKNQFLEYQESGLSRHYTAYKNSDLLAEALMLALDGLDRRSENKMRRVENAAHYAKSLTKDSYTLEEVRKIIEDVSLM